MSEILQKLRPDRDLQCYFFRPSAIAALSQASATGFTLSGSWRQQFDWAVIEWNRDNVFEHPAFRNLPDGDLSGLTLSYEETRSNCIAIDSDLFPTVDWPSLRIWADSGSGAGEQIYKVPLKQYAIPIEGAYQPASVEFELTGTGAPGDLVGVAALDEHYPYLLADNPLAYAVQNIVQGVESFSPTMRAVQDGTKLRLSYLGSDTAGNRNTQDASTTGANGNRFGIYTYGAGSGTATWDALSKTFSGGTSPSKWRITLPFNALVDPQLGPVPTHAVRKMRWTYAADLQASGFTRSEFAVQVSNWQVTGPGRTYSVAGPGSRRLNDDAPELNYSPGWTGAKGNFSGGTIRYTSSTGASLSCPYSSAQTHSLYIGTRRAANGASIRITVDGNVVTPGLNLNAPEEDVLFRHFLGQFGAGEHNVTLTHAGPGGSYFYFDFLEIAIPSTALPSHQPEPVLTLATDWDTDHSIALAPERTAWIIDSLGFKGRVNHYAGAMWFYELVRTGHRYASGTVTFNAPPQASSITQLAVGRTGSVPVTVTHLNLIGETVETLAKAFELKLNSGYTAIWAKADGPQLTVFSRSMGLDGNTITMSVTCSTAYQVSGPALSGGQDGDWRTDLTAVPRVNRAARDWTRGFCSALKAAGHDSVTVAFSTELQHGDPSPTVGIAQRYPSQQAVMVNTPALQTNFSNASLDFWKQVYADIAQVQIEAAIQPYVQFGEVQWWYFTDGDHSGMPFYDAFTTSQFRSKYGRDMAVIRSSSVDPATVPLESAFLPSLIGNFTSNIIQFVRALVPNCRFEVLYPTDVNDSALNRVINYPTADWTPAQLDSLKTESFTYTFNRDLNRAKQTMDFGQALGFPASRRSHLVGLEDSSTAWVKECRLAEGKRFNSVVLFALDQFCLMGYALPLSQGLRRSVRQG